MRYVNIAYRAYLPIKQHLGKKVVRSAFGAIACSVAILGFVFSQAGATTTTFSFGTGGDHGATPQSRATFQSAGASNIDLFQSNGDYSYNQVSTSAWCQLVKDNINIGKGFTAGNAYGENFPFMLATGNHEAADAGDQIEDVKSCLPNQLAGQTTLSSNVEGGVAGSNYAREYFYDYPAATPIARFIVTAAGSEAKMTQQDGNGYYDYSTGTVHYNWLSSAIDSARAAGIKWIIVTNHENYITAGSKPVAEVPSDYFNLLLTKKVDLFLQGHEHNYQRSKQLTNGVSGCTSLPAGSYNANCIASDGGVTNTFTKGDGMIDVIVGTTGGDLDAPMYAINTSDPEYNYFGSAMGLDDPDETIGFMKFDVSDTAITGSFIPTPGYDQGFRDSFTIQEVVPPTDTTAPAVSLTAPTNGATVSGASVSIAATASDAVGVTKVEFYKDAVKLGEDTSSPYSFTWDTTAVADGSYTITAKAHDAALNIGTSAAVAVTVKNTSTPNDVKKIDFSTTTSVEPDAISKAVMTITSGSCSNFTNAKTISANGITAPESTVSLIGGFDFNISCVNPGGTANVAIGLGKLYSNLDKLRVYKINGTTITDVTSKVSFSNTSTATTLTYTLKDGSEFDDDLTQNSIIKDPLYVGVLGDSTTTSTPASSNNTTQAQNGSSQKLASTGQKINIIVISAISLVVAAVGIFLRRNTTYRVNYKR